MINLLRYYLKIYIKSNKFVAPVVLWIIFLYVNNTTRPASFVSNLSSSGGILYFVMIWLGFVYMELEDTVSEQLLILKVKNVSKYNMSKVLFLILIGIGMSIVGIIVPITQHMINGYTLYTRNITVEDIIYSFILLSVMSFLGSMIGSLFHPRIFRDRKIAMLIVFIIGLLGYTKGPLIDDFPVLKFILWVFPPVYDILMKFANQEYFSLLTIGNAVVLAAGYGLILLFIQLCVLKKNKF